MSGADERGDALARGAEQLVGCPFRLRGRDPATGIDCVGLFALAWRSAGGDGAVPCDYTLRTRQTGRLGEWAQGHGLSEVIGGTRRGDVIAYAVGPAQVHIGIAADAARLVHAHAGLRRVVLATAPPDWQPIGHWRWAGDPANEG